MKFFYTHSIKKICLTIVFSLLIISCTTSTSESVDSSNNDSSAKTQKLEQSSSETAAKTSDPTPQSKASDPTPQPKASDPIPQPKSPDPTPQSKASDPTPQPKAPDPTPQPKTPDPTPQSKAPDPTPQSKASDPTPQPTATPEVKTNQIDPKLMAKLTDGIKLGLISVEVANEIISDVMLGKITVQAAEIKLMGLSDDQKNQGNQGHNTPNPCATVPKRDRARCEEAFKSNPNVKPTPFPATPTPTTVTESFYVQNFDPNNIPKVAKFNFTELDKFSRMTKIRSGVGHDFSARTPEYDPAHLNCKSMKHYFMPVGVPRQMSLYRSTPHTFKWMDIKFFSPVDGEISDVSYTQTSYGTEAGFYIGSSEFPGYFFKFFHLALDPNLTNGSIVKAGQQIGTLGGEETWGEIAVEVRLADGLNHLISFLQVASDDVLQQYKDRGINSPADVIVTKEQRDANPLACDDSPAGWFIGSGTGGTPEDMQFIIWVFESTDNWFFFTEMD